LFCWLEETGVADKVATGHLRLENQNRFSLLTNLTAVVGETATGVR
jgi:hypothetical protein